MSFAEGGGTAAPTPVYYCEVVMSHKETCFFGDTYSVLPCFIDAFLEHGYFTVRIFFDFVKDTNSLI